MTAEQFVKQYYPKARVERYVSGHIKGMQEVYYLVWTNFSSKGGNRLSEGKTKSNAWVNAKKNVEFHLILK